MQKLLQTTLDWIYPPRCMSCRNPLPLQNMRGRSLWLCAHCENLFLPIEGPRCTVCSVPVKPGARVCPSCSGRAFYFENNRAAFIYEDLIRDMIHEIKFRKRRHVAQGLGRLWAGVIAKDIPAYAILVPLPMHPKKRRERGFDQAEVMAAAIAETTGIKLIKALERIQDTPPQSGLHPQQRAENVRGAFRVPHGVNITGESIMLIDDIYTTGASLNECARVLKAGGAEDVFAMTLAIAQSKSSDSTSQTFFPSNPNSTDNSPE